MHITFSFGGMAIFYAFSYQYFSLNNNSEVFHRPKIIIAMFASMILYGFPPALLTIITVDIEAARAEVKQNTPQFYQLFITGACNMNKVNLEFAIYVVDVVIQIFFVYLIAVICGIKIIRKLQSLKSSMSKSNLKVQKQFVMALTAQMTIPMIFIIIPITFLLIEVTFGNGDIAELSQWVLQFFGLHSSGNAIAVMVIFKPYRQRIIGWFKKVKRTVLRQSTVSVESWTTPSHATSSSGILSKS
uniref:Uncharacterized protein n=1 Tax=Panagrolaimus davidi TaxID=227884 RepID=A0A914PK62_9BILA